MTLTGAATLPVVYVLAALGGLVLVVDAPGRQTLTFQMVGPAELQNAVALNSGLFNASRVIGPAIAGLLIAAVGTGLCFVVNAFSFLAVLVALRLLRPEELTPVERQETRVVAGVREGIAWAFHAPLVRTVLVVVTVVSTVGFNFHVLVPLLASQTLEVGAETFGILSSAFGLGALAGALGDGQPREASPKAFVGGAVGFSLAMLALALVDSVPLALVLLFDSACRSRCSPRAPAPSSSSPPRSSPWTSREPLPVRLRGARADRRPRRRLARGAGRHAARLRCRRRRRPGRRVLGVSPAPGHYARAGPV